jgi:hypothetical protein
MWAWTQALSHTKTVKESKGNNTSLPFLSFFSFFLFLFFFRSINLSAKSCNNQHKRIVVHSHFKLILIFRDSDSRSRISKAIAECSERIFDQGQIRWKEHELSFTDCTKTHQSDIKYKIYDCFLLVLNLRNREGKKTAEMWEVLVDFVVTKNVTRTQNSKDVTTKNQQLVQTM